MGRASHRSCAICGIRERHSGSDSLLFSNFPLDYSRCREWLRVVGNAELVDIPIEKLHSSYNVCGNHFLKKDFNKKGNRLKRHVIPTRNLSAAPLTDSQLTHFPQHVAKKSKVALPVSTQATRDEKENENAQPQTGPVSEIPSTSQLKKNILMELPQNVSAPVPTPSTSHHKEKASIQPDKGFASVPTPSTSDHKEKSSILPDKVKTPTKRGKTSMECDQDHKRGVKRKFEETLELTPRKKKLMEKLKKTRCNLASLKRSAKLIESIESPVLKEIVNSAILNQKRKPKGRRWTTKNKISALAIFKRSPKTYRYLQHLMPLPSIKTLLNVLKKVPMNPGINNSVIEHLKKTSTKTNAKDKYCSLVFDEIALKPRLIYDAAEDKIQGYQDLGLGQSGRSGQLADHALVFMIQGIKSKFKQPIAHYFVKGTVSSHTLATKIQEIIDAVQETGYNIISTICDQGPTNMGALKILKDLSPPPHSPNQNFFERSGKKIYIIYDVPHLFKSIRNNFLNYGELHMNGMKAKWVHLSKIEETNRQMLYLSKITPMHVQPKYRAKMRVKYAAQILSNTVSAVLKLSAQAEKDPVEAQQIMQTGTIVHDLDRLFDYTNGPSRPEDIKKGRRENVSTKTDHVEVWAEYMKTLETVRFKKPTGETAKNVRCILGYLTTLRSLRDIWGKLNGVGFKYLNLRQLNQDALENLFGIIRQHSPTNRNPTCYSFTAALKTSVISGLTAPHSRGSNCERDFKTLLTDFHDIVFEDPQIKDVSNKEKENEACVETEPVAEMPGNLDVPVLSIPEDLEFFEIETDLAEMEKQPLVYVSGYIASVILKHHNCINCGNCLKIDNPGHEPNVYSYIKLREWWKDRTSLTYPTITLCRLVETAVESFETDIIPCLHYLNICKYTVTFFMAKCDNTFFTCVEHKNEIINQIYLRLALLLIRRQCQRQNVPISMQEESLADANKKVNQHFCVSKVNLNGSNFKENGIMFENLL